MSITESFETFTGQEPVATWTAHVGVFSSVKKMGEEERLLFALQHISDDVRGCVMSLAGPLEKITGEAWNWDWLKFKVALKAIEGETDIHSGFKDANSLLFLKNRSIQGERAVYVLFKCYCAYPSP